MRTIPQVPSGLQGLTSCCHSDATFVENRPGQPDLLVCRACRQIVQPVAVIGAAAFALEESIMANIREDINTDELWDLQQIIVSGNEPPVKPHSIVLSSEDIQKNALMS